MSSVLLAEPRVKGLPKTMNFPNKSSPGKISCPPLGREMSALLLYNVWALLHYWRSHCTPAQEMLTVTGCIFY